jgi:hypothetical protein
VDSAAPLPALAAGVLVLTTALVREALWPLRISRMLSRGRYTQAREVAEGLERSWSRVFPSTRRSARYAIACALHLEGNLEGSLAALGPLHEEPLRDAERYAVASLDASSLVLLGREPERAESLLASAGRIRQPSEDLLLGALIQLALGRRERAAALFEKAGATRAPPGRDARIALIDEQPHQRVIFHALRGMYLAKTDGLGAAKPDLEIAAKSALQNVYVERARELLAGEVESEPDEGPSSLAPVVAAK